jgi:hypothetical protein
MESIDKSVRAGIVSSSLLCGCFAVQREARALESGITCGDSFDGVGLGSVLVTFTFFPVGV